MRSTEPRLENRRLRVLLARASMTAGATVPAPTKNINRRVLAIKEIDDRADSAQLEI